MSFPFSVVANKDDQAPAAPVVETPVEAPAEVTAGTFPSWRYGPNGESRICQSPDDVPEGWEDHPSKVVPAPTHDL